MAIPDFDSNSVIPPHLGDPTRSSQVSPYRCTSVELCDRFSTSAERVKILGGFLKLRAELRRHGMVEGFQWIDGSFLEDVETTQSRAPRDIDVATFYWSSDPVFTSNFLAAFPKILDRKHIKTEYWVDHYPVDAGHRPEVTIEATRFFYGLFSHTRNGVWKGMLRIDLNTPTEDSDAVNLLTGRP